MTSREILRIFLLLFIIATAKDAVSQTPFPVKTEKSQWPGQQEACADQFAGNVSFSNFSGQSNDIWGNGNMPPDTIFLCADDAFDIAVSGQDLTGDPDPSTTPGVGYALYNCQPTISGPDKASIEFDCHYSIAGEYMVSTQSTTTGSQTFSNNGSLIGNPLLGNGSPICIWFAPITFDALSGNTAIYENSGPCVNVNINDAFPVVYLNPIQVSNIKDNVAGFTCMGSFVLQGGLPEYAPGNQYTIDVSLTSDPSVKALIIGSDFASGNTVKFQVSEPGTYNITVSDGKSCSGTGTVTMAGCPTISMDLPDVTGQQGTKVCIPVTVTGFTNIGAIEFVINFDPNILSFNEITSSELDNFSSATNYNQINSSQVVVVWSLPSGDNIPDGNAMIEICFDLIGPPGSSSPVWIGPNTNGLAVSAPDGTQYGVSLKNGSITIANPNAMDITLDSTDVVCNGDASGSIDITVSGGSGFPVTVDYNNNGGNPMGSINIPAAGQTVTISNLTAGVYNLHFVDTGGAVKDTTIQVLEGPDLGINLLNPNTLCFGDTADICPIVSIDGIQVSNLNGYSFVWDNGSTDMCQHAVPAGNFAVTVTDPNGCTASASGALTQPAPITLSPTITNPTCSGVDDGTISVTASGGTSATGNYTFTWAGQGSSAPSTSTFIFDKAPGTYYLTVTDDNGCTTVDSFTLQYQKVIDLTATTVQDISCNGTNDGSITVTASNTGGTASLPYTFTWNPSPPSTTNPDASTEVANNLSAGTYQVTATDADGCLDTTSAVITEPTPIIITLDSLRHESCTVGTDGFISVSATGGNGNFSFAWNTTPAQNGPTINNLPAGTYTVTVTDASGCTATDNYTINPPTPPTITDFAKTNINCPSDTDGALTPNVTAGNGSIVDYSWDTGQNTASITGLSAGTYCVTITDEYGCQANACDSIVPTEGFFVQNDAYILPTCVGYSDGSIILTMSGSGDYSFSWDNGGTTATLAGIPAGTYQVTIVDNQSSCPPIQTSFTLNDPPAIIPTTTLLNGASCFDGTALDGSANTSAMYSDGSAGSFTFTWQPNFYQCQNTTSCTATNLGPGDAFVTIDDGTCSVSDTIFIPAPDSIKIEYATTPASCYGYSDGGATALATGGTPGTNPDYIYQWTPSGQTGNTLTNVTAGNYTLLVTDGVGCSETFDIVVDEPDLLEVLLDLTKTVDVYCNGESTGQIFVQPIGGNGNYDYSWSPNVSNDNVASMLPAGTYSVTVTDDKGCTAELTHTLNENEPITATLNPVEDPQCFGYQTTISIDTVFGGAGGPYTYSVDYSPPQSIQLEYQVFADSHYVTIYDALECSVTIGIDVNEPEEIFVSLPPVIQVELGDSIQLHPVISSPLPVDSFYWLPPTNLSDSSLLHPFVVNLQNDQAYELTVIDSNGCSQTAATLIEIDRNRNVYIPNIFSPNDDGFNDVFFPKTGIGVKQVNSMTIYDRWGNLIYSATNFLPGDNSPEYWDGKFNGKIMNPGVFVYLIEVEFLDGKRLLYRGDVTLVK